MTALPMSKPPIAGKRLFVIKRIERHTPDVKVFTLVPKAQEKISFTPGMFVSLSIVHEGKPFGPKPFSISSSPLITDGIELTMKKEGDFTSAFFRLEEGAEVIVQGPYGKFVMPVPPPKDVVLLAAGTGIAPLMSMLRTILDGGYGQSHKTTVTLIFSCKDQHHILFKDELARRQQRFENFHGIITLTREDAGSNWQGHRGRITPAMLNEHVRNRNDAHYFICGPGEFIKVCEEALNELDVLAERIHREKW